MSIFGILLSRKTLVCEMSQGPHSGMAVSAALAGDEGSHLRKCRIGRLIFSVVPRLSQCVLFSSRILLTRCLTRLLSNGSTHMISGQASHWLIETPTLFNLCVTHPSEVIVNFLKFTLLTFT